MSSKASSQFLLKIANPAPEQLSGTIARASSWPQYKIPNFELLLKQYNDKNHTKIDSLVLTLDVKSRDDVRVTSAEIVPAVGTAAQILPEVSQILEGIKQNVPKYFSVNYETLNGVPSGTYVATYKIPLPEGTGVSNRQR